MINAGTTNIIAVELYDDGKVKLEEFRVMLDDEIIARSWKETSNNGEIMSGVEDKEQLHHYTLPLWYKRYKKLNEIL